MNTIKIPMPTPPNDPPATATPGPQAPPALDALTHRYLQHLELVNYSRRTLTSQVVYFHRFAEFLAERKISDVRAITTALFQDFQHWLFYQPTIRGTARTIASQNRVLSSIKGFFAFLVQEGYLAHNPAQGVRLAREPDALPKNILTPEEARRFIEAPDTHTLIGYRDRTLLEVLMRPASAKPSCATSPWRT